MKMFGPFVIPEKHFDFDKNIKRLEEITVKLKELRKQPLSPKMREGLEELITKNDDVIRQVKEVRKDLEKS